MYNSLSWINRVVRNLGPPENIERFYYMLSPLALYNARPFLNEEQSILRELAANKHLVVIGAGPLTYLDLAQTSARSYTAVEPLIELFVNRAVKSLTRLSNIPVMLLNKSFSDLNRADILYTPNLFVFHFNVIAYIPNPHLYINNIITPGDTILISKWNDTPLSQNVMKSYFKYVDSIAPLTKTTTQKYSNGRLDAKKIKFFSNEIKMQKEICDFHVINTK